MQTLTVDITDADVCGLIWGLDQGLGEGGTLRPLPVEELRDLRAWLAGLARYATNAPVERLEQSLIEIAKQDSDSHL